MWKGKDQNSMLVGLSSAEIMIQNQTDLLLLLTRSYVNLTSKKHAKFKMLFNITCS